MLEQVFFGNRVAEYLTSLALLAVGLVLLWVVKGVVLRRVRAQAESTETSVDDFLVKLFESSVFPVLCFGAFYLSIQNLTLPAGLARAADVLGVVLMTFIGIRLAVALVYYSFESWLDRREEDEAKSKSMRRLLPVVKMAVWAAGLTFLLDNLGFEISAVIAGLGIGGIAVALAAQAVLGDLFSYFSILLDRPFELGDFIILDDYMGTIEHIGIKTTRIRSLGGEQLVLSNTDLTSSRVRNYKRMTARRVTFAFGVLYQSTSKQLREIPGVVADIVDGIDEARLDRAHFASFGDSSLDFEVVYYVATGDYTRYMDIQQEINLKLFEELEARGIGFAYPTRTVFIENSPPAP